MVPAYEYCPLQTLLFKNRSKIFKAACSKVDFDRLGIDK